jgi:hypothetical protein
MDIATTLSVISSAREFASLLINRKIDSAVTEKAIELQSGIISLQSEIMAMQAENQSLLQANNLLKDSLKKIEDWSLESERHELVEITKGVFVYKLKKTLTESCSPWLCTNCFENQKKSILQWQGKNYGGTFYQCPNCSLKLYDHSDAAIG